MALWDRALAEDDDVPNPMLAAIRDKLDRLAEGSSIVQGVKGMTGEDQTALGTAMIPVVGDIAGGYADVKDLMKNWSQRSALSNAAAVGATALGIAPFVPSRSQAKAARAVLQDAASKHSAPAEGRLGNKGRSYKGKVYRTDGFETYDLDASKTQSGVVYFADDKGVANHFAEQFAIKTDVATPEQLGMRSRYLSTDEWTIPEPREFNIEGKNLATVEDVKRVGKNPHRRTSVSNLESYEVEALKAEGFDGVIGTPDRLSGTEIGLFDVSGIKN